MGLRIGSNYISNFAARHISRNQHEISRLTEQLASGSRLNSQATDPASFAISEHLKGQSQGIKAAQQNAQNAISFLNVAEGALNEQNNILIRMRELSIQSASDTISDVEREFIDTEFQQLKSEITRIAETTQFGQNKLLTGSKQSFEFHVGAYSGQKNRIHFELSADTTASGLEINDLSAIDQDDALDSLESIDQALVSIATARSQFASTQSRLQHASDHLGLQHVHIEDARSKIADTDYAEAISNLVQKKVLQDYQIAILAQANQSNREVGRILMG